MTVTYSDKSFLRLLFRWRGSVWKDIYKHYTIFIVLYFIINFIYRFGLNQDARLTFERTVKFFHQWNQLIPLQFLIGFYVSSIFCRWWQQLNLVAWPDRFLLFVCANIPEMDADSILLRKTFARYANLLNVLVWKEIAVKIKKRFPTDDHLAKAGLMTADELQLYKNTTSLHGRWFVPVSWMSNLLLRCRKEGRLTEFAHQKMVEELCTFKGSSAMLTVYDWVNIPLVYTQVVTLSTYSAGHTIRIMRWFGYFAFCLVARQGLIPPTGSHEIEIYFPLFTSLEFIFYIGWMKVGEDLRCPFGETDDDFDMNYVLDRNIHVSNMLVHELHQQAPAPTTDPFTSSQPTVPHTVASWKVRDPIPKWRLSKMTVSEEGAALHGDSKGLDQTSGDTARRSEEEAPLSAEETTSLPHAV